MTDPFTINRLSFNHETVFYAFFSGMKRWPSSYSILASPYRIYLHTKLLSNDSFISLGLAAALEGFLHPKENREVCVCKKSFNAQAKMHSVTYVYP